MANARPSPPASEVSRAAGDAATLILAGSVAQLVAVGLNILLRRELGPAGMAYVVVVQLALTYTPFASLGVLNAAERELPIELARGRRDAAVAIERFALTTSLIGGLTAAVLLLVVAGTGVVGADTLMSSALIASAAVVVTHQLAIVSTVRLRTRLRFSSLAALNALQTVAFVAVVLAGAVVGGVHGALIGTVIASIAASVVFAAVARPELALGGLRTAGRHITLLAPGFLFSSLSFVALLSIDQIAVGFLLGPTMLGVYSAAILGKGFVLAFPTMVGAVIYPRLQRELGTSSDPAVVHRIGSRTTAMVALAMPLVVAAFYIALPPVIRAVLPAFGEAVDPLRLLLVAAGGLAFGIPAVQLLISINRQWLETSVTAGAVGILGLGSVLLAELGLLDLIIVALLTAAVYSLHGLATQALAAVITHQSAGPTVRMWLIYVAPLALLLVITPLTDGMARQPGWAFAVLSALTQIVIFLDAWALSSLFLLRVDSQARTDVSSLIHRGSGRDNRTDRHSS